MPVAALAADYPAGAHVLPHTHRRAQLLYAISGVMIIDADAGRWVVPPTRAVWLPPGLAHSVQMRGAVQMRTVFIEPGAALQMPGTPCVIHVRPLLRELILAATELALDYTTGGRDELLARLLLAELGALEQLPLHLPWPTDARLRKLCTALQQAPEHAHTLDHWAARLGMSEKTLQRLFQHQTGVTYGRWRQQARLLLALEQLARGEKILSVALAQGYQSQSAFAAMFKRHFGVPPSTFYA